MIGGKLHALMGILRLDPYTDGTQECKPLGIISESAIEPAYMVCPQTMECQNASCNQQALHLGSRDRDVPLATLIKGTKNVTMLLYSVVSAGNVKQSIMQIMSPSQMPKVTEGNCT